MTAPVSATGILAVYEEEELLPSAKDGLFTSVAKLVRRIGVIDRDALTDNLRLFCEQMASVTENLKAGVGAFELESFEVALDVTAKGEVRLIASAASEIKGGLKLVFKKTKVARVKGSTE